MGMLDSFKKIGGGKQQDLEIVGTIVEGPTPAGDGSTDKYTVVFRLDTRPDLEFRQVVSALAPKRRRGDRVKVHCRLNGSKVVTVEWVEKAA